MNLWDYIILAAVAGLLFLAVRRMLRRRKRGCCCGCEGCGKSPSLCQPAADISLPEAGEGKK